jgi:hypothetical protein
MKANLYSRANVSANSPKLITTSLEERNAGRPTKGDKLTDETGTLAAAACADPSSSESKIRSIAGRPRLGDEVIAVAGVLAIEPDIAARADGAAKALSALDLFRAHQGKRVATVQQGSGYTESIVDKLIEFCMGKCFCCGSVFQEDTTTEDSSYRRGPVMG